MPFQFSAFGLSLRANRRIPGLIPRWSEAPSDTTIWLGAMPVSATTRNRPWALWYVSQHNRGNHPSLRVWRAADSAHFRLRYDDGVEFLVDADGGEVWASWPDSSTLADATTYLLGPVLGFVLRLRGITCLHASAVAVGDRAIALLGPAQAGKSTTAATFCQMGHSIIADDVVALAERDGTLFAQPAYPQLRLWPDSVELLYGAPDALPRLTPSWDKRALDLSQGDGRFQQRPLPLAAIYVLAERRSAPRPRIEGLRGREAIMTLVANTYVGYLLDAALRAHELESLGRLVSTVPVRRVVAPGEPTQIAQLCHDILSDCEAIGCTPSPTTAR